MLLSQELINKYISYFFSKIVGFKKLNIKYMSFNNSENEYISIAMDKVDRLTRKNGRLRTRVWSNCIFIFHQNKIEPVQIYQNKVSEIKKKYPFLFVRSYVYFIFIDISNENQMTLLNETSSNFDTKDFKIWYFNTKYEVKEETRKTNIFGVSLDEKENIDDYIYLTDTRSEIERMKAANSDVIDCIRAFTGELELLEQTSKMLDSVNMELEDNPNARILVEGPARSGKTIIAATLLHLYQNSKFLLMNYFFYQAIIDGLNALSGFSSEEIDALVKNPELDFILELQRNFPIKLDQISKNFEYAIKKCNVKIDYSNTKKYLLENICVLVDYFDKSGIDYAAIPVITDFIKRLKDLEKFLKEKKANNVFSEYGEEKLSELKCLIDDIHNKKYDDLEVMERLICQTIEELIKNSKQRFFHHNINTKISQDIKRGCWITRGTKTVSKMWSKEAQADLIICDEVQRLGIIPRFNDNDEFDEIYQLIKNSKRSFFTGDNFQMLNNKYDCGINRINKVVRNNNQNLIKFKLAEAIGVPDEIGLLMKYLTHPDLINIDNIVDKWKNNRDFEIILIRHTADKFVDIFDRDSSSKKHFGCPMDSQWMIKNEKIQIQTPKREKPIIRLGDHEKDNFAYKFPYFCNEEIMPNYILSAYELISREVESLYVHIPNFYKGQPFENEWYKKHLYVLFTRATMKLVVNFENDNEFERMMQLVKNIKTKGAKVPVNFIY